MSFRRVSEFGASSVRLLLGVLLLVGQAAAQPSAGAMRSAPPAALSIWYRSSEGCPEGSAFVARLAELGRQAVLASVGDRVDFVVTVARATNASSGRLERQTARGTVAIRELEALRCEEVAEALALSLEIALDPARDAPASSADRATDVEQAADAVAAATPAPRSTPRRALADDRTGEHRAREGARRGVLGLGAQASLTKGIAPGWALGGALFGELRAHEESALAGRLSLAAASTDANLSAIEVDVFWLAGRVEGCAFELRSGALAVQPCAGAELGLLRAGGSGESARRETGFWAAAGGLLRASYQLAEHFAIEAQVGAALPLMRYALGSSRGGDLFRTEAVTPAVAVGGRWSP